MSDFTSGNLTRMILADVPFPETVETLSFEDVLAQIKADYLTDFPDAADIINLETDPLHAFLERLAAEVVKLRAHVNDEARNNTLAHGFGASLENWGAFWNLEPKVIDPGDEAAVPPIAPVIEDDEDFRLRIQLAPEGLTTAGPAGSYIFHALTHPNVKSAKADRTGPGQVTVWVLTLSANGIATAAELIEVAAIIDPRRPLCSDVIYAAATVPEYTVEAELTFLPSYDPDAVLAASNVAVEIYTEGQHALGKDVTLAGLYRALVQTGVQNAAIASPAADIVCGDSEAAYCTGITLTNGGFDE